MKVEWAKQSKEKFLEYFKKAAPQLYVIRFKRKRVKFLMNVRNSAITGGIIRAGKMVYPKQKAKKEEKPEEPEDQIPMTTNTK